MHGEPGLPETFQVHLASSLLSAVFVDPGLTNANGTLVLVSGTMVPFARSWWTHIGYT